MTSSQVVETEEDMLLEGLEAGMFNGRKVKPM